MLLLSQKRGRKELLKQQKSINVGVPPNHLRLAVDQPHLAANPEITRPKLLDTSLTIAPLQTSHWQFFRCRRPPRTQWLLHHSRAVTLLEIKERRDTFLLG